MNDDTPKHHELIEHKGFALAVALMDGGDTAALQQHVTANPELLQMTMSFKGNYFNTPTLLEFIAENPVRHDAMPANATQVAKTLLDLGFASNPDAIDATLGLVSSGRVAREQNQQVPLINLLCEHGANPTLAIPAALAHGEFAAIDALIAHGAQMDLTLACGTGRINEARSYITNASSEDKRFALAMAAQHGQLDAVKLLLDNGVDLNQHNPVDAHAHATPLHLAVQGGHLALVKLMVAAGARLDIEDTMFNSTPAGWAQAIGHPRISDYLESL